MTFLNLPELLPDETLYSWAGHVHLASGNGNPHKTSSSLYGQKCPATLISLPAYVKGLTERFPKLGTAEEVVLEHSSMSYYLPALEKNSALAAMDSAINGTAPRSGFFFHAKPARERERESRIALKSCPECQKEQLKTYGRTYWITNHQYPSVVICPVHLVELRATWVVRKTCSSRIADWVLPKYSGDEWKLPHDGLRERYAGLATDSCKWAALSAAYFVPQVLQATYRQSLKNKGLITDNGSIRLKLLHSLVSERFFSDFSALCRFGVPPLFEKPGSRPFRISTSADVAKQSPLFHLLLIGFLFEDWERFLRSYQVLLEGCAEESGINARRLMRGCADQNMEKFVELLRTGNYSLRRAGGEVGIAKSTASVWAKKAGVLLLAPHTSASLAKKGEKLKRLAQLGLEVEELASRMGVAKKSIFYALRRSPDIKSEWSQARIQKQKIRYREEYLFLRKADLATDQSERDARTSHVYHWLRTHDKEWVASLPRAQRRR